MKSAMQITIRHNSKDLFDFLIYQNIDLTRLLNGMTYLYLAVCDDRLNMVQKLVKKVNVNAIVTRESASNHYHDATALVMAAANGHTDIVNELLAHRTDINIQNGKGHTALELARLLKHKRVAKIIAAYLQGFSH